MDNDDEIQRLLLFFSDLPESTVRRVFIECRGDYSAAMQRLSEVVKETGLSLEERTISLMEPGESAANKDATKDLNENGNRSEAHDDDVPATYSSTVGVWDSFMAWAGTGSTTTEMHTYFPTLSIAAITENISDFIESCASAFDTGFEGEEEEEDKEKGGQRQDVAQVVRGGVEARGLSSRKSNLQGRISAGNTELINEEDAEEESDVNKTD